MHLFDSPSSYHNHPLALNLARVTCIILPTPFHTAPVYLEDWGEEDGFWDTEVNIEKKTRQEGTKTHVQETRTDPVRNHIQPSNSYRYSSYSDSYPVSH